jgi:hypothetical protein
MPPLVSGRNPFLVPHSFLSLSADPDYARLHAGPAGQICAAGLIEGARVLDLRHLSESGFRLWRQVRRSPLGCRHAGIRTYHGWQCCVGTGGLLRYRYGGDAGQEHAASGWQAIANASSTPESLRTEAHWHLEDFARAWIESVVGPARDLGHDAVICPERMPGPSGRTSLQLFVFDPGILSPPVWLGQTTAVAGPEG